MSPPDRPRPPFFPAVRRTAAELLDFIVYSARRFYRDNCFQTAASLTYTTLLAIVPIMTIGFAIFTAFPAFGDLQNEVKGIIFRNIVPEIGDLTLEYINRFVSNAGQMTVFGVIGLAVSAVLLIWTIEGSFAGIWREREPRSLVVRILSFWAIVSLTPMFAGASLSLSSSLWHTLEGLGVHEKALPLTGVGGLFPMLVSFSGFSLLYLIAPNRPVTLADAARGGAVAAVLFEVSKAGFAWYLRAFPAYQTIYGALGTVPIFLFWLYIGWSTVLFGAVVAAALPEWRAGRVARGGVQGLLPAQRLAIALALLHELHGAARLGVGLRRRTLVSRLGLGSLLIDTVLEQLRDAHWVALTTSDSWVITRDLAEANLQDLVKGLGIGLRGSLRSVFGNGPAWTDRTAKLLEAAEAAQADLLSVPIRELFETAPAP